MKNVKVFRKLLILSILSSFALVICSTDFYRATLAQGTWQTKASTPTPIAQNAVGVVNGKLYSVGGASAAICCNTQSAPTFAYDPATDTWATRTSMSVRRKNLAAGVINGVLYAIGGDNDFSAFATNEAYDPATDTWTARAPMPTARSSPSIGVVNGILYVIGGENSAGPLTTVEAYDPVTNTWTTKAPMLHARSRGHAAVGVNGMLYAIGGFDTNGAILATVEAYDPVADTWTSRASMPTARNGLAAAAVNGIIYAIGGNNGGILSTVEAYDPVTDTWTTMPSMPTARDSLGAAEINGVVYAVGGFVSHAPPIITATVEAFTPSPPACVPPPSGLVTWLPGDGNANDIVGGNNGVLGSGATFALGIVGQAFSFDGTSSVTLTNPPPVSSPGSWTYDLWINASSFTDGDPHGGDGSYFVDRTSETQNLASLKAVTGDQFDFQIRCDGCPATTAIVGGAIIHGKWTHIAMLREFGVAFRLYVDGLLVASAQDNGQALTLPVPRLGHHDLPTLSGFVGLIDEFDIFNRALSASEIQAIFNAGSAGKCKTCTQPPTIAACAAGKTLSSDASCRAAIPDLTGEVSATSNCPSSSPLTITQSPAAGTLVGLGDTTVTMTVKDSRGNASTCTARITVVDTTPPAITCSPDLTLIANLGSNSSVVTYAAPTATDNCTVATVACSPASGSSFSVGATTVTCAATDSSGNTASCAFTVTVLSPQQATQSLIDSVNNLVSQGTLNQGQGNALNSKLDAAIQRMNQGNGNAAGNQLQAFINQVNALINSGRLSPSQGQALIDAANNLIAHIP